MDTVAPDIEHRGKDEICAIGSRLVPSLNCSTDRTGDNGEVEDSRYSPLVEDFGAERLDFFLAESLLAGNVFIPGGILGNKRASSKQIAVIIQVLFAAKLVYIAEENSSRNSYQRILDSAVSKISNSWKDSGRGEMGRGILCFNVGVQVDVRHRTGSGTEPSLG